MRNNLYIYIGLFFALFSLNACQSPNSSSLSGASLNDNALLDSVQHRTFQYFYDGAEPVSGMARERIHIDGEYPQNDQDVVTLGGSGFGVMSLVVGAERGFITAQQAQNRISHILTYLGQADRYHGAWSHWLHGPTGKTKSFSTHDDGADVVETAFMAQALIVVREYYKNGNDTQKAIAQHADSLWKGIDWDFFRNGQDVLFWHWSPTHSWGMNHAIKGYDECLIAYVMAASSPTHPIPASAYHKGWARDGAIKTDMEKNGYTTILKHNAPENAVGPLFWAHYSYLGLDPKGLKDQYADYWKVNTHHAFIHYQHALNNPKEHAGYGPNAWGLTASYSIKGYDAHHPDNDHGVISPTAALASIPYTPEQSMQAMRYYYDALGPKLWGKYGFYDAFSEGADWFPQRYLAIDQGPVVVMIENYRSGLIWNLFMGAPDVQQGLKTLGFESPHLKP